MAARARCSPCRALRAAPAMAESAGPARGPRHIAATALAPRGPPAEAPPRAAEALRPTLGPHPCSVAIVTTPARVLAPAASLGPRL